MGVSRRVILAAFIIVSLVVMLLPYAWMLVTSLRPNEEVLQYPPSLIKGTFTLSNYPRLFEKIPFIRYYFNSTFVTITASTCALFTSALAGFAFAKYRFPGRDTLFYYLLATLMIPIFVLLVPLYVMMIKLRWMNTYYALIIPFLSNPFGIFLMRQFIGDIPDELIDAARIDGCSEFGIFRRVVIPLSKPALSALFILLFMTNWDSFMWPLIMINSDEMRTIPLGLMVLNRQMFASTDWNLVMVGVFLGILPILAVYLFTQKHFIRSMAMTGLNA